MSPVTPKPAAEFSTLAITRSPLPLRRGPRARGGVALRGRGALRAAEPAGAPRLGARADAGAGGARATARRLAAGRGPRRVERARRRLLVRLGRAAPGRMVERRVPGKPADLPRLRQP